MKPTSHYLVSLLIYKTWVPMKLPGICLEENSTRDTLWERIPPKEQRRETKIDEHHKTHVRAGDWDPVHIAHSVWPDTRICNLRLKQILLLCVSYLKTSNKNFSLLCAGCSRWEKASNPFIFFNQSKTWKCLPTLRCIYRDLWLFLGKNFIFLTVSFH